MDVEAGVLAGGESVDVASQPVDLTSDLDRRAPAGPLEQDVLEEVGKALLLGRLILGAGSDEETEGEGANVLHSVDQDGDAVVEEVLGGHSGISGGPLLF